MNVIIYVRGREMEQRRKQKADCEQYAAANGMTVDAVLDEWQAVKERIEKGDFDGFMIAHRSRVSRSYFEYHTFEIMLQRKGIKLINISETEYERDKTIFHRMFNNNEF